MRTTSKKYTKYAKEFKQELDLQTKDYEQYQKLKQNVSLYQKKISDLTERAQAIKETLTSVDAAMQQVKAERDLIAKAETELVYLQ
jgi:uncharacterized phage infection (PIP) family protein YhgE